MVVFLSLSSLFFYGEYLTSKTLYRSAIDKKSNKQKFLLLKKSKQKVHTARQYLFGLRNIENFYWKVSCALWLLENMKDIDTQHITSTPEHLLMSLTKLLQNKHSHKAFLEVIESFGEKEGELYTLALPPKKQCENILNIFYRAIQKHPYDKSQIVNISHKLFNNMDIHWYTKVQIIIAMQYEPETIFHLLKQVMNDKIITLNLRKKGKNNLRILLQYTLGKIKNKEQLKTYLDILTSHTAKKFRTSSVELKQIVFSALSEVIIIKQASPYSKKILQIFLENEKLSDTDIQKIIKNTFLQVISENTWLQKQLKEKEEKLKSSPENNRVLFLIQDIKDSMK